MGISKIGGFCMKRLLIVFTVIVLAVSCFAACSSSAPSQAPAASPPPAAAPQAPAAGAMDQSTDYYETYEDSLNPGSATPLPLLTPSNADGKKIVYTVALWLQTTDFDAGARKLLNTVSDLGGYVQSAYVNGRDLHNPEVERNASYTLRVPSEKLSEFLVIMEDNYTLYRLEQESQDITAKKQQTDTRLDDLRDQEKRLLETIAGTTDAREKLSLERQLADVQSSISSLDASQSSMDNDVIYSTVTVNLFEVIFAEPVEERQIPFSEKLSNTVSATMNGFLAFGQGLLLFTIVLLPVLLALAVIAVIILLIRRVYRKIHKVFKVSDGVELPDQTQDENENE